MTASQVRPPQGVETLIPIANEMLDMTKQVLHDRRLRAPTGEDRYGVPTLESVSDLVRAEKARSAEDQDAQGVGG
jgi:hypothetical protein